MSEEVKVWRSRITPTVRGAIFRAKRWFYATFYKKDIPAEKKEESRRRWAELARVLVEKTSAENLSDYAARITIHYNDSNGIFKPVKVELETFIMKPHKKLEFEVWSKGGEVESKEG